MLEEDYKIETREVKTCDKCDSKFLGTEEQTTCSNCE